MRSHVSEREIDHAIEEAVKLIDEQPFSGTGVSKRVTVRFLEGIVSELKMRIEVVREEMKNA